MSSWRSRSPISGAATGRWWRGSPVRARRRPMAEAAAAPAGRGASWARWPRPRLIDLYLVRGLAGPFLLITLGACVAMMLERALRLIQEMAAGGAHVSYFFPMLGQLLPYYLNLALPAAFM